ncbi:MAG: MFS transporter, partial [Candidatus Competibacteraceae bacterium]|nr:MFS transporter [Candidatus Competibacteraceae bacterium]
ALTCGRLLAIPLATHCRPRHVLAVDLLGALGGMGLILALPGSVTALWAGTLLAGFAMASVFPTALTFVQRRTPVSGRVTGWFMVGAGVGSIATPWLIGRLMDPLGMQAVIWVVAAGLLLALAVFAVLLAGWREPVQLDPQPNDGTALVLSGEGGEAVP